MSKSNERQSEQRDGEVDSAAATMLTLAPRIVSQQRRRVLESLSLALLIDGLARYLVLIKVTS